MQVLSLKETCYAVIAHQLHQGLYKAVLTHAYKLPSQLQTKVAKLIMQTSLKTPLSALKYVPANQIRSITIQKLADNKKISIKKIAKAHVYYLHHVTSIDLSYLKNVKKYMSCFQRYSKGISTSTVTTIDLSYCNGFSFSTIQRIHEQYTYNLTSLCLAYSTITSLHDAFLPHLKFLDIRYCSKLNNKEIQKIIKSASQLTSLLLTGSRVKKLDNEDITLCQLQYLDITSCHRLTNIRVEQIIQKTCTLHSFHLAYTNITAIHGCHDNLKNIFELDMSYSTRTSNEIKEILKSMPPLKILKLAYSAITDFDGVDLSCIELLDISHCANIPNQKIQQLQGRTPHLRHINVSYTSIASFDGIDIEKLEALHVDWCLDLPALAFNNLQRRTSTLLTLTARGTQISDFTNIDLENLQQLDVSFCENITDNSFQQFLGRTPKLQILLLTLCPHIESLDNIDMKNLRELDISGCAKISQSAFQRMKGRTPYLEIATLRDTSLTDLNCIDLNNVTKLNIANTKITKLDNINFEKLSFLFVGDLDCLSDEEEMSTIPLHVPHLQEYSACDMVYWSQYPLSPEEANNLIRYPH